MKKQYFEAGPKASIGDLDNNKQKTQFTKLGTLQQTR